MTLRSLPPLAQLRAFAALAEAGSMSAAGELLNVSHAAISQQVRALEAHLGLSLIERQGRGIALTDEGARLSRTVQDGFGAIAQEIEALTGADADRPLQITTTPSFASAWLMPRIGSFRQIAPDVDLMINPTAKNVALEPGGVDLAVRFGKGDWPGLEAELLVETRFVIAAARELVGDTKIDDPAQLLDYPWLQEIGTTETNDWLASRGVTATGVKSSIHLPGNLILDGLRSAQGIVATAQTFIRAELDRGDVVVLFEEEDRGYGYFLVTRPGPQRAPVKAFIKWLRQEARRDANIQAPTA